MSKLNKKLKLELDVFYYRGDIEVYGGNIAAQRVDGFSRGRELPQYPWQSMSIIKKHERDLSKRLIFVDPVRKTAKWANGHNATDTAIREGLL